MRNSVPLSKKTKYTPTIYIMRYLIILLIPFIVAQVSFAQEDDMYFPVKKKKETPSKQKSTTVEVIYISDSSDMDPVTSATTSVSTLPERDVDEYNRRSRNTYSSSVNESSVDTLYADEQREQTTALSAQNLYNLGYTDGYQEGYSDGNDMDFYYGLRLARFHGCHYYDPWYWSRVTYVYDPWYWDPWHYDPWYRPYHHVGWYSVGWGPGYWGNHWNPYYHSYYHGHYPHYHWGGHHSHGPRISTSRNHDYGRSRIADRSNRASIPSRNSGRTDGYNSSNRSSQRSSDRATRMSERSAERKNRVTDRSGSASTNRSTSRSSQRSVGTETPRRSSGTQVDRSSSRSTNRSSSHIGSGSSSRGSSFGSYGGGSRSGGSRSTGSGRGR